MQMAEVCIQPDATQQLQTSVLPPCITALFPVLSPVDELEMCMSCHAHVCLALHPGCAVLCCAVLCCAGDQTLLEEWQWGRHPSTAHACGAQDASGFLDSQPAAGAALYPAPAVQTPEQDTGTEPSGGQKGAPR